MDDTTRTADDTDLTVSNPQPADDTSNVDASVVVATVTAKPARNRGARKPAVRKPADALNVARRFADLFPAVKTAPYWAEPAVVALRTIHANVKPESRTDYRAVLRIAETVITLPSDGTHAFTLGGASDIAKTQNALYVAFALAGIPRADVPDEYGAAIWTAVLGPVGRHGRRCDYSVHTDYFGSTLARMVANDHNLTPGIPGAMAAAVVAAWRKPAKS